MTLVAALLKYCRIEGETTGQFATEVRKLTAADRSWYIAQFKKEGVEIEG